MIEKIGFIFDVLLVFSLPVILFLMLYRQVRKRRHETKSYVKVNAQITSIEKEDYSLPNPNGGEIKGVQDVVCYRYHVGGKDWENRHRTFTDDGFGNPFAKKTISESIEVLVDPKNPHRVAFDWGLGKKVFIYGGVVVFGLLSLSMFLCVGFSMLNGEKQ